MPNTSITLRFFLLLLLLATYLPASANSDNTGNNYVGSEQCAGCHAAQYKLWQQSHHRSAMLEANEQSVLGDFNDSSFVYAGVRSRFYRKDSAFYVDTDNAQGEIQSFKISYTFGLKPLQQYLIAFPDRRYQALNIAWDSRPKKQGGQRWFHLYPDQAIDHTDQLHWTGAFHNWNSRCASCHSTNLQKNYSQTSDSYDTRFSEVNVACEACHGPAAEHITWTRFQAGDIPYRGFAFSIADSGQWQSTPQTSTAHRLGEERPTAQIDTCAHCHARRVELSDPPISPHYFDSHQSQFIAPGLYYPDGQIRDEVYVYDAFKQSKMHANGVVCADCHNPHSGQLKLEGNGVCLQCHQASTFDVESHHHHKAGSRGASCANCHMPETTFMVVDPRRDHGLKIPRPDLSLSLGTPNACNQCHTDQSTEWALAASKRWYGEDFVQRPHYATALAKAWQGDSSSVPELAALAADPKQNSIVRATALQAMAAFPQQLSYQSAMQALRSEDPALRIAALRALEFMPAERRQVLLPLINDPVKAVRMELAPMLAVMPAQNLPEAILPLFNDLFAEYIAAQRHNADMPGGQLNLGIIYAALGDQMTAEQSYLHALKLAPQFVPALLNLADLYRSQGSEDKAKPLLKKAIAIAPEQAPAHHALGLLLVRQKQNYMAINSLRIAAELAPEVTRYSYVYGVALESDGKLDEAITVLEDALSRHSDDYQLISGLIYYYEKAHNNAAAENLRERLQRLYPQNQ